MLDPSRDDIDGTPEEDESSPEDEIPEVVEEVAVDPDTILDEGPPPELETDDAGSTAIRHEDRLPANLFLLPVPDVVLFPELAMPVVLESPLAQGTVEQAKTQSAPFLGCVTTREVVTGDAGPDDLYAVGTLARVLKTLKLPDGNVSVVLQGVRRFRIEKFLRTKSYLIAKVSYPDEILSGGNEELALTRNIQNLIKEIVSHSSVHGEEFRTAIINIEGARGASDFGAAYFVQDHDERQSLLEEFDVSKRLHRVAEILTQELELLRLGSELQERINQKIQTSQREFFLREQIKAIQRELGEDKDEVALEIAEFEERLSKDKVPEEVEKKVRDEIRKLRMMSPESAESSVVRNYLDWLLSVPWSVSTEENFDIAHAESVLARDHFGLEEIKERILEFLSVRKLRSDHKGPILCFVGPPGVGKTSLGRSIAQALNRAFYRLSVGGLRDEAEIRGHRRTYIGAMPGRIIQGLKAAGANNPVIMLDEIDKIGSDFRGDPASALLEALDPEQNVAFTDHYLELPVDLSRVMFITTANQLDPIRGPLLDRMEVISINGYTLEEKVQIAKRHLLPRCLDDHGLPPNAVKLGIPALREVIRGYTHEAGVRGLEKALAKICRKVAVKVARGGRARSVTVAAGELDAYMGAPRQDEIPARSRTPGVATGLAWTPVGGEVLLVESLALPGGGSKIQLTGMLGEVMLESARIAYSWVKANLVGIGLKQDLLAGRELHVHVPAGAIPKDGPSAGITMAASMVSLLAGRPIRAGVAMTGELTLTGKVLPVGGVRDKILAAKRIGVRQVILPAGNEVDVDQIPAELLKGLDICFVDSMNDVLAVIFGKSAASKGRRSRS